MSVPPVLGAPLVVRRVRVPPTEVVYVKGIIEASEGLAVVFAESGGELMIATMPEQLAELDLLLCDLRDEIGALLESEAEQR